MFPNFIRIGLMLRTIQHGTVAAEFDQAFWMSLLFALRTPSGTLKLTRAYRYDEISAFPPQRAKALIGLHTAPEGLVLAAKLK